MNGEDDDHRDHDDYDQDSDDDNDDDQSLCCLDDAAFYGVSSFNILRIHAVNKQIR